MHLQKAGVWKGSAPRVETPGAPYFFSGLQSAGERDWGTLQCLPGGPVARTVTMFLWDGIAMGWDTVDRSRFGLSVRRAAA